jgi:hypothetical protein
MYCQKQPCTEAVHGVIAFTHQLFDLVTQIGVIIIGLHFKDIDVIRIVTLKVLFEWDRK